MKKFLMGGLLCLLTAVLPTSVQAGEAADNAAAGAAEKVQLTGWELLERGAANLAEMGDCNINMVLKGGLNSRDVSMTGLAEAKLDFDAAGNFKGKYDMSLTMQEGQFAKELRHGFRQYGEIDGDDLIIYTGLDDKWTKSRSSIKAEISGDSDKMADSTSAQLLEALAKAKGNFNADIINDWNGRTKIRLTQRQPGEASQTAAAASVVVPEDEVTAPIISLLPQVKLPDFADMDVIITVDNSSGAIRQVDIDLQKWIQRELGSLAEQNPQQAGMLLPGGSDSKADLHLTLYVEKALRPNFVTVPYYIKSTAREVKAKRIKTQEQAADISI